MKIKQIIVLLLINILLAVSLYGCSSAPAQTGDITNTETSTPQDAVTNPGTSTQTTTEPSKPEEAIQRINPTTDTVATDIIPFGNTRGIVVHQFMEDVLPEMSMSYSNKQIFFLTENIDYSAGWDTYLVDGYIEKTEKLLHIMEQVIRLSFAQEGDKLKIHLVGPGQSGYSEPEYRSLGCEQRDAFMGNSPYMISYLADILQGDQVHAYFCDVLRYGFMTYATYDVLTFLESQDPNFSAMFSSKENLFMNYLIMDSETLYEHDIIYWLEQGYPYTSSNGSAALGFWFMKYLDETYGNYTHWLTEYAKTHPTGNAYDTVSVESQVQNLKDVYGENVLTNFYPWLEKNLDLNAMWDTADYSALSEYCHYPNFTYVGYSEQFFSGNYNDLIISLSEFRYYMTEIKGYTLDHLTLSKFTDNEVVLYDKEGKYLMSTNGVESNDKYLVFLDDAYYIGLPGQGFMDALLLLE